MGIMDQFSATETDRTSVTVGLEPADAARLADVAAAMKTKGCKNRGDFARKAIMASVAEVEKALGGPLAVKAAADKIDPEGTRHERKTREKGKPATAPAKK